jgi:hypothetical protein
MTPEIAALKQQRDELTRRIREAELVEAQKSTGFAVGDLIEFDHGKTICRGRVVHVKNFAGGPKAELEVVSIKKDGTEGFVRAVYYWANPRLAAEIGRAQP